MKFNFYKHKDLLVLLLALVLSLLSMWMTGRTSLKTPVDFGLGFVSFFQSGASSVAGFFANTFSTLNRLSDLQRENQALHARLQEMEGVRSDIELLQEENKRLKTVLKFSQLMSHINIPANVIAKTAGSYFTSITINKGHIHGVRQGMPVISAQEGTFGLVGKVQKVSAHSSLIEPVFSTNLFVGVRLAKSRFDGLLRGNGLVNQSLALQYVDLSAQGIVQTGEAVVTSGLNKKYPPDILVGTIASINARPYESTLTFEVLPVVDYARLEYVFVIDLPQDEE